MISHIIRNKNDEVINEIKRIISVKQSEKIMVLGSIDDYSFEIFNDIKNTLIYISIDKKYTTYKMMEDLLEKENVFVYDNNLHKDTKKENIIFNIDDDEIEMLMSSFEFTKDNLENADSIAIYIKGNKNDAEMKDILSLYEYYKNNLGGYIELDNNLLNNLEDNKSFRNSKINTIFEEMQIDEVISSFRNKENAYKNLYESQSNEPVDEEIDIEINID